MEMYGKVRAIILGAGISGLIKLHQIKNGYIISESLGQYDSVIQLGPRYLHYCKETEKLLSDLGLSIETRTVQTGYERNGIKISDPDERFLKDYSRISGREGQITSATMNGGKKVFKVFKISEKKLAEELLKRYQSRIIMGKVTRISVDKKEITALIEEEKVKILYDRLYTTLPVNVFISLARLRKVPFKSSPIYFTEIEKDRTDREEMIYSVGEEFYRYTFVTRHLCIGESCTPNPKAFAILPFGKIHWDPRIRKIREEMGKKGIYFVGRGACHDPKMKIEDVIKGEGEEKTWMN